MPSVLQTPALLATTSSGCQSTAATTRPGAQRNRSRRSVHTRLLCLRTLVLEKPALERSHNRRVLNKSQAGVLNTVSYAVLRPRQHVYSNNGSRNEGSFTSSGSSHAPESSFPLWCTWGWSFGSACGVNAWVQADRGWQRPGYLPHSLGLGILVAKKCTSIFYRSVGWIPGLCFHVSFNHF